MKSKGLPPVPWVSGFAGSQVIEVYPSKKLIVSPKVPLTDVFLSWISLEGLIEHQKQETCHLLYHQYRSSKYLILHGDTPLVRQVYSWVSNRRDDALILQLLWKMLISPDILSHFGLVFDERSSWCQVTDSLEHILFSCPKYVSQRNMSWDSSVLNKNCFRSFIEFSSVFSKSKPFQLPTLKFCRVLIGSISSPWLVEFSFEFGLFEPTALLLYYSITTPLPPTPNKWINKQWSEIYKIFKSAESLVPSCADLISVCCRNNNF